MRPGHRGQLVGGWEVWGPWPCVKNCNEHFSALLPGLAESPLGTACVWFTLASSCNSEMDEECGR